MRKTMVAALLTLAVTGPALGDERVMPPAGTSLILSTEADGVQVYVCQDNNGTPGWTFKNPEASLFDASRRQIGSHGAGPFWKLEDGSMITGDKVADAPGEHAADIPWLLLKTKTHDGQGMLSDANWVRRSATVGGIAPVTGCDASHLKAVARMRYSATYQFFR